MSRSPRRRAKSSKPVTIGPYSCDEYVSRVQAFHGNVAPGPILGGFMVDLAMRRIPRGAAPQVLAAFADSTVLARRPCASAGNVLPGPRTPDHPTGRAGDERPPP